MKTQYFSEILRQHFDSEHDCIAAERAIAEYDNQMLARCSTPEQVRVVLNELGTFTLKYTSRDDTANYASLVLNDFGLAVMKNKGIPGVHVQMLGSTRATVSLKAVPLIEAPLLEGRRLMKIKKSSHAIQKLRSEKIRVVRLKLMLEHPEVKRLIDEIHARSHQVRMIQQEVQREADARVPIEVTSPDAYLNALPDWTRKAINFRY